MRTFVLALITAVGLWADSFPADQVQIVGDIDYGQTSPVTECASPKGYCALVFNGQGGDQLEITVKNSGRKAFIALTDGSLKELARGTDTLRFQLPKENEELQTYYIVFRDAEQQPGKFTIELKKLANHASRGEGNVPHAL